MALLIDRRRQVYVRHREALTTAGCLHMMLTVRVISESSSPSMSSQLVCVHAGGACMLPMPDAAPGRPPPGHLRRASAAALPAPTLPASTSSRMPPHQASSAWRSCCGRLVCWAWRSRSSSCAASLIRDGAPLMRCSGGGLCRKRRHQMRISLAAVAPLCGRLIPCSLPAWAASPLQSRCTCRAAWHGWPLAWRQAERARHCGTRNMKLHLGISRIAIASAGL